MAPSIESLIWSAAEEMTVAALTAATQESLVAQARANKNNGPFEIGLVQQFVETPAVKQYIEREIRDAMAKWPYNTERWQSLRLAKLRHDPLCEYCSPGLERPATQVDHKKAIRDGGDPWDWGNLASACQKCHSEKTAGGEKLKGCHPDGRPRDPNHEWYH